MKKICTIFFGAFIVLICSCEKEPYLNAGFNAPIYKDSNGQVIVHVTDDHKSLNLHGSINLLEGDVVINLYDPEGMITYSIKIIAPGEIQINESYKAEKGFWELNYESNEGIGTIDLHLYN